MPMNKLLLIGIILIFMIASCKDTKGVTAPQEKSWNLPIARVNIEKLPIHYTSIGSVVSDQRIDISSKMTGFIKDILVREGDLVSQQQLLISLDSADVEGSIEQAEAEVNSAKLVLQDADVDVQRYAELFNKGSISESSMRKTNLFRDRAKDSLQAAKTALAIAKSQRKYIQILSDMNGVVVERYLRKGDLATPGKAILTIESNQDLFFDTYVVESQINHIKKGAKVAVFIDALEQEVEGVVARVVSAGDSATRQYKVKIALENHVGLLSGMFGRVNFILDEQPAVVVPNSALIEQGGLRGVFVVDEQQKAHFRWLQLGSKKSDYTEVRAGLAINETIVLQANTSLREGDVINRTPLQEHGSE